MSTELPGFHPHISQKFFGLTDYLQRSGLEVSRALKALRARRSWSVDELAGQAGTSGEVWRSWERGAVTPTCECLVPILQSLYWIRDLDILQGRNWNSPDEPLWEAFHSCPESIFSDQPLTDDAICAFEELDLATFGTNNPEIQLAMLCEALEIDACSSARTAAAKLRGSCLMS